MTEIQYNPIHDIGHIEMDHQQEDNLTPGKRAALDTDKRDVKRVFTFDKEESSSDDILDLESSPIYSEVVHRLSSLQLEDTLDDGDPLQKKAIELAMEGKNIFLTGKAGTGKSWTTRKMLAAFSSERKNLYVTAPTGIAAIQSNGVTLNSWGGFGLGEYYSDFDRMYDKKIREKICKTHVLVIEEVSMLDGHLFDALECMISILRCYNDTADRVKRIKEENITWEKAGGVSQSSFSSLSQSPNMESSKTKRNTTINQHMLDMRWEPPEKGGLGDIPAFGGMQIVLVGDFYQLPPIPNKSDNTNNHGILLANDELWETEYNLKIGRQGSYAFESCAWQRSNLQTIELEKIHRQADNDGLVDLLNAMRVGNFGEMYKHNAALSSLKAPLYDRDDGILPTELYSKNRKVDERNREGINQLPADEVRFKAHDEVELDNEYKGKLLRKYKLEHIGHMPYLFGAVETVLEPPDVAYARCQQSIIQQKICKEIEADEMDMEVIAALKNEKKELSTKINAWEEEKKRNAKISLDSFKAFMEKDNVVNVGESAEILFERYKSFNQQLVEDFERLKKHATDVHFQDSKCRVPQKMELKKDAQVMLLWNLSIPEKLANGSRGVVKGFVATRAYHSFLLQEFAKRKGLGNFEKKETDCGECKKEDNSQENIQMEDEDSKSNLIASFDTSGLDVDEIILPVVLQHITEMQEDDLMKEMKSIEKVLLQGSESLPYVQFTNEKSRLILPQPFGKVFKSCGKATRWQCPLTLAWAISIHKSQGMTIDWLKVDLQGCFDFGQAYVACSRGRSLKSMVVENFSLQEIKVSEKVQKFYDSLTRGELYSGTWKDSIYTFDQMAANSMHLERKMKERYRHSKCSLCDAPCIINQVKSNTQNQGKWYLKCSVHYRNGHTFEFVPMMPHEINMAV